MGREVEVEVGRVEKVGEGRVGGDDEGGGRAQ